MMCCLCVYRTLQRPLSADISEWNPFGDDNFGDLTEDTIFGQEFDRMRTKAGLHGSNSSEYCTTI